MRIGTPESGLRFVEQERKRFFQEHRTEGLSVGTLEDGRVWVSRIDVRKLRNYLTRWLATGYLCEPDLRIEERAEQEIHEGGDPV